MDEKTQILESGRAPAFVKPPTRALYGDDHKIVFEDLDPATSYTIKVNTILNGIVIASKEAKIYQMG